MATTRFAELAERYSGQVASCLFPSAVDDLLQYVEQTDWHVDALQAYCPRCGASAGQGAVTDDGCAFCVGKPVPWTQLVRLSAYESPMDEWIRAMKFAGQWRWGRWLGRLLADVLPRSLPADRTAVVPVAMHWVRRWRRGYNQAQLIASAVAEQRGWPLTAVLQRTRYTLPQTSLAPSLRPANVRRSFALAAVDLSGWSVLLVDDVKTSGSTLAACTRLLRQAGAVSVTAVVAAVADPQNAGFRAI